MKKIVLAVLALGILLTAGCVARNTMDDTMEVYFLTRETGQAQALQPETRVLTDQDKPIDGLLQLLLSGPVTENLTAVIPGGVTVRDWNLTGGLLTVDFSSVYGILSGINLTLADYSVVLTMTQLEEVEAVTITVDGHPLSYRDHQKLTREDIAAVVYGQEGISESEE